MYFFYKVRPQHHLVKVAHHPIPSKLLALPYSLHKQGTEVYIPVFQKCGLASQWMCQYLFKMICLHRQLFGGRTLEDVNVRKHSHVHRLHFIHLLCCFGSQSRRVCSECVHGRRLRNRKGSEGGWGFLRHFFVCCSTQSTVIAGDTSCHTTQHNVIHMAQHRQHHTVAQYNQHHTCGSAQSNITAHTYDTTIHHQHCRTIQCSIHRDNHSQSREQLQYSAVQVTMDGIAIICFTQYTHHSGRPLLGKWW